MMGHILGALLGQGFPTSNVATLFGLNQRFEFQAVNNAFVSVDTFFLMSGCLVSYLMLKELDKTRGRVNFLVMYIHRYLRYYLIVSIEHKSSINTYYFSNRLTGFYGFLIFFLTTVWRHCGSGPNHIFWYEAEECAKNSWVNLLYINNFDVEEYLEGGCLGLGVTWYLANDMQFFLIAPPIIYMTWHWKKIGFTLIGESSDRLSTLIFK